jgi:hypothetical protein
VTAPELLIKNDGSRGPVIDVQQVVRMSEATSGLDPSIRQCWLPHFVSLDAGYGAFTAVIPGRA